MYSHVFVAGTFDGLHKGHEIVLRAAFAQGEKVTIGLTSNNFVQNFKTGKEIAPFNTRKTQLKQWLAEKKLIDRSQVIAIDDPYEPAVSDPQVEALVVTAQNKHRGEEINQKREERGLKPLILVEVPLVPAEDGQPISTTRVRNGEIDREGRLVMPESLRPRLQLPLGQVLTGSEITASFSRHPRQLVIAVGDMAAKTLFDAGVVPGLAIVDYRVGRQPFHELEPHLAQIPQFKVKSGPGYISQEAMETISQWFKQLAAAGEVKPTAIIVDGEEDLLTLPVVISAPIGSVVYYGQPPAAAWACGPLREGLVEVEVTKDKQQEAIELLGQFK